MSSYDNQYYIIERDYDINSIFLKPSQETADREYDFEKVVDVHKPLFFHQDGLDSKEWLCLEGFDILMDGYCLLVNDKIRDFVNGFSIQGLQILPSIIIGGDNVWHEGYSFLNFYELLDCWSRTNSVYEGDDNDVISPSVDKISFDNNVLDKIPLEKRVLFRLGGAMHSFIIAHECVVRHMKKVGFIGVKFYKVSDFVFGDQYP